MTTAPIERLNASLGDRYRVVREIGRGGMATVYLAEDVKHHRNVAVKVLREDLTISVGGTRFLREIEIAAQLQHPNILPLLDSGDAGGLLYYVMPFVEGQSLRQRLAHERELPIGEAVRLFAELIDALAYAHSRGVVHRDIKPDNIMLSGRHALITDFGVARALSAATGGDNVTSLGVALGTPAYMAPEQATADPNVDHRADIYSAGVVAYELLAGRTPFQSSTPQQMLAAQVTESPDPVAKHRPGVSPQLDSLVMKCLAKRPADRWQTSGELLAAIEPIATPSGGMQPTSVRMSAISAAPSRTKFVVAVVGLTVVAAGAWFALNGGGAPSFALGKTSQLTTETGMEIHPAIAPDGKLVAYAAGSTASMRIFIRPVGGGRTLQLTDDSVAIESDPRWSPDGTQLLFLVRGGVSVASALGGPVRPVAPPSRDAPVAAVAWSPTGGEIAFARLDSLYVVPLSGGTPRLVNAAGRDRLTSCAWSPDGRWIACVDGNPLYNRPGDVFGNIARSDIRVFPASGGASVIVNEDSTKLYQSPVWSPSSGELFFVSNRDGARDVFVQRIGGDGHRRGPALRITTGANAHSISMTADGAHLAYSVFTSLANLWALPIPSGGPVTVDAAVQLTSNNQTIEGIKVSRDGKWVIVDSDLSGRGAIYRVPVAGGTQELLVGEAFDIFSGDVSPDGKEIAYHSFRNGTRDIEVKPLDGGSAVRVTDTPSQESWPVWSADGQALAFYRQSPPFGVYVVRRDQSTGWGKPAHVGIGQNPRWLPDGRIVFVSDTTRGGPARGNPGREIAIVNADGSNRRVVFVAERGGPNPARLAMSPDGKVIYFKMFDPAKGASFWSVPTAGGTPRLLVRFADLTRPSNRADFDVDAKRFYFRIEDRKSDIWVADLTKR